VTTSPSLLSLSSPSHFPLLPATPTTMSTLTQAPCTGFSFENTLRNSSLANKNLGLPKATSTGTTIVGCLYENGIVLGADTRATEGPIVADKNCEKVNFLSLISLVVLWVTD